MKKEILMNPRVTICQDGRTVLKKQSAIAKIPMHGLKVLIQWDKYIGDIKQDKPEQQYFLTGTCLPKQDLKNPDNDLNKIRAGTAKTAALREIQTKVLALKNRIEIALGPDGPDRKLVTHEDFMDRYEGRKVVKTNFKALMDEAITTKKLTTGYQYNHARKEAERFYIHQLQKKENRILSKEERENIVIDLLEINTEAWLKSFEKWVTEQPKFKKGKMTGYNSLNTAALYLRGIRIAFGVALDKKLITEAQNPFGKRKFQIRTAETKKIALSVDELIDFMAYKPKNEMEQIAHDFTVFSYLANGMNFIDIANLTEAQLKKEHFTFFRQKTMDTALVRKEIIVGLTNEKIQEIIERRRVPGSFYIFGILNEADVTNEKEHLRKVHNFRQNTNRAIKAIAKNLGICDETFSTYTMRHTFTQIMLADGVDIAIVAQCLGHMSVVTTQKYAKRLDVKTAQSFYNILVPTKRNKKVVEAVQHEQAA